MTVSVSHTFVCNVADDAVDAAAGKILPSHWDASHTLSGLGTGVLTALGVNVGTVGSFVVNGGALGTPSSGVATNLTGMAAGLTAGTATTATTVTTNANLTGPITSVGNATSIASQTGTGATFAMSASPTFTGTLAAAALTTSGATTLSGTTTVSGASFGLTGAISSAAWTTSGVRYKNVAATLTDTSSSGTVATAYTDVWGGNTIAASSSTTFTNYFGSYFNVPVAGTNVTLTSAWAIGADSLKVGTSNQVTISSAGVTAIPASLAIGGVTIGLNVLAANGTSLLVGGTLADGARALKITATQPSVPTSTQYGVEYTITGNGSTGQINRAFLVDYSAGYTGSSQTVAGVFSNENAGTGNTLIGSGINNATGNLGLLGSVSVNVNALAIGVQGRADSSTTNVGVLGTAQIPKNSGTNIGVVGTATNTGTSPVLIGGFFTQGQTTVPTVSAALIADNGGIGGNIALFRNNNSTVALVDSSGDVLVAAGSGFGIIGGAGSFDLSTIRVGLSLNNASPVSWTNGSSSGGTVDLTALRSAAGIFGLRGVSTTTPASAEFYTYGASPPAAGAASTARLYVDTSGGKDRLVVIFSSGAAQVLATQP